MNVALVQLDVRDGAPEHNLVRALHLIGTHPGAELYLLPELWSTGYAHDGWEVAADQSTPQVVTRLQETARTLGAWIGGSLISRNAAGGLVNRLWLLPPEADPIAYDKAHLFAPMQEDRWLEAGSARQRAHIGPFHAAVSICYDLRYPEHYRLDALAGADLFLVVSEWPATRGELLRLFARSRAAENQAYLALCNRVGTGRDGTRFGGGSAVVGPTGEVLVAAGDQEEVVSVRIDPEPSRAARANLDVLGGRRPGVDW